VWPFSGSSAYIFTLRPGTTETIVIDGEKPLLSLVKVTTGNEGLDKAMLRVWLSLNGRIPLRFAFAAYTGRLVNSTKRHFNW